MYAINSEGLAVAKIKFSDEAERTNEFLPYRVGNRVLVRTERRLLWVDMEKPGKITNLMPLVDLQRDAVHGKWELLGESWKCSSVKSDKAACLRIPFQPKDTYIIEIGVKKLSETGTFAMGLVSGGRQFVTFIDQAKTRSGIENLDDKPLSENESLATFIGRREGYMTRLRKGELQNVRYEVSPTGVRATVGGFEVFAWRGDISRLQPTPEWDVGDAKSLFIGWQNGQWQIESMTIVAPK